MCSLALVIRLMENAATASQHLPRESDGRLIVRNQFIIEITSVADKVTATMTLDPEHWPTQSPGDVWETITDAVSSFSRHHRHDIVPSVLAVIGGHVARCYRETYESERRHIANVRQVMRSLGAVNCTHDCTKDPFYVFVLCGKWNREVNATGERFNAVYNAEIRRHFGLEPHHPEYEEIHYCNPKMQSESPDVGRRYEHCAEADILEMAVDRLERNIASTPGGRGPIDWENVKKYWPVFHVGDVSQKSDLYGRYFRQYEQTVAQVVIGNLDSQCWTLRPSGTRSTGNESLSDSWEPELTATESTNQSSVTVSATSDRVVITIK